MRVKLTRMLESGLKLGMLVGPARFLLIPFIAFKFSSDLFIFSRWSTRTMTATPVCATNLP